MAQLQLLPLHHGLLGPVAEKASNPLVDGTIDASMVKPWEEVLVRYCVNGLSKVQHNGVWLPFSNSFARLCTVRISLVFQDLFFLLSVVQDIMFVEVGAD